MELKNICKRTRSMWYLRNTLFLLLITFVILTAIILADFLPALIIGVISWVIFTTLLLIWPALSYKNYSYGYNDKRFYISYGVIFKHRITAPLCQIQDLHYYEGPIMQLFKIGKVIFATGGSNFELTGLDKAVAQQLVDEIEELLRKRIEVNSNEEI